MIRNTLMFCALSVFALATAQANELSPLSNLAFITLEQNAASALNVIDWKVGDQMAFQVSVGSFGKIGTSNKAVTQDTGETIWVRNEVKMLIQNETVEMEIRKSDAKIVKMIRNGQEQEIPSDKIEIISQEGTTVTVPAGTFECGHIVAKSERIEKIELWINPRDTVMDGGLKQAITSQGNIITLELTSFRKN